MIKLIATDLDGTLIKDASPYLYPEMVDAIGKLKEKGIIFCAASGRQYESIRNVFREVPEEIAYIAENGAHIHYQGKDIAVTGMERHLAEEIILQLREYYNTCDIVVSTLEGSLIESRNRAFIDMLAYGYRSKFRLVEDVLKEKAEIIKVAIYQEESIRELGEGTLIPQWQDRVKACMAGEEWVDFMDQSVDKGNALAFLQNYCGITKEETMAFGDNGNDIGMMHAAGYSYAVENARAEVKAAAKFICPSYLDKGVYQIINSEIISDKIMKEK